MDITHSQEEWIYSTLNNVSRSFSFVIKELPIEIKNCVAIFYLILRSLDTIEDDMNLDINYKIQTLKHFHLRLTNNNKEIINCGDNFEKKLMLEFNNVIDVFVKLPIEYQQIIIETTRNMGEGMTHYINDPIETIDKYDQYCFYVAGLVGVGLSTIFVGSNLETKIKIDVDDHAIANGSRISDSKLSIEMVSMGLFLQKTNIIRDFYEDMSDGRIYWPKEIYNRYANNPVELIKIDNVNSQINSVCCLNEMIENALEHFPECLEYISKLENEKIVAFCSIPQIMALATLNECYNNVNVFSTTSVKISREITGKILLDVKDNGINSVMYYIKYYLKKLEEKMVHKDVVTDCLKYCLK